MNRSAFSARQRGPVINEKGIIEKGIKEQCNQGAW